MEKEIEVPGMRKVKIKELKFLDVIGSDIKNRTETAKLTLRLGTDLTEDEISNLTFNQGKVINQEINDLNGLSQDFQKL